MKFRAAIFLAAMLLAVCCPAVRGQVRPRDDDKLLAIAATPNQPRGDEYNAQTEKAVAAGLEFMATHQLPDGGFTGQTGGGDGNAGITALCAMAFMESGSVPGRGKYGKNVEKALDFVLGCCRPDGLISSGNNENSPMYTHGFATLFLGEIYGMTNDDRVVDKLRKAVRLIERTQNPQGGWRYQPVPYDADISVTIAEIMALRAARDAGIKVDAAVMQKSIQYVLLCQNADGSFNYLPGNWEQGIGSSVFRAGAGCASLYYAGVFHGDNLRRGLDYVATCTPNGRGGNSSGAEPFLLYGYYYAVQAMFLAGGDYWANFWPPVREWIVKGQKPDGSWTNEVSQDFSTAMALIILQMPNRYLPVFNGKGPGS